MYSRQEGLDQPQYTVEQLDKQFRARVKLGEEHYASTSWEKNKKFAEQGAALVPVKCLEITVDRGKVYPQCCTSIKLFPTDIARKWFFS